MEEALLKHLSEGHPSALHSSKGDPTIGNAERNVGVKQGIYY